MYTRQQASELRQAFWTAFGQYMSPIQSADGEKINWLNYKTGEKHLYFKMYAEQTFASIGIEITHPSLQEQKLFYDHFLLLKNMLHDQLQEDWDWVLQTMDENGKVMSKIWKELPDVNVFNKEHWPSIISFFKPRIIALDAFWSNAKYGFEALH